MKAANHDRNRNRSEIQPSENNEASVFPIFAYLFLWEMEGNPIRELLLTGKEILLLELRELCVRHFTPQG